MGPAFGGTEQTTNTGGGSTNPEQGSTVETSWNPHNACTVDGIKNATIADMLACIAEYIDSGFLCKYQSVPPPGLTRQPAPDKCAVPPQQRSEYDVTYLPETGPPIGLNIVRWGAEETDPVHSTEPYRMTLRETSVNLQRTSITVNRPMLNVWIKGIEEPQVPLGGSIYVSINNQLIAPVVTNGLSCAGITQRLLTRIQGAGFNAVFVDPYIIVRNNGFNRLTQVSFRSSDPGIKISEIHLDASEPTIIAE
jgi:hypothetical protein